VIGPVPVKAPPMGFQGECRHSLSSCRCCRSTRPGWRGRPWVAAALAFRRGGAGRARLVMSLRLVPKLAVLRDDIGKNHIKVAGRNALARIAPTMKLPESQSHLALIGRGGTDRPHDCRPISVNPDPRWGGVLQIHAPLDNFNKSLTFPVRSSRAGIRKRSRGARWTIFPGMIWTRTSSTRLRCWPEGVSTDFCDPIALLTLKRIGFIRGSRLTPTGEKMLAAAVRRAFAA
jgi:hypothetical protein